MFFNLQDKRNTPYFYPNQPDLRSLFPMDRRLVSGHLITNRSLFVLLSTFILTSSVMVALLATITWQFGDVLFRDGQQIVERALPATGDSPFISEPVPIHNRDPSPIAAVDRPAPPNIVERSKKIDPYRVKGEPNNVSPAENGAGEPDLNLVSGEGNPGAPDSIRLPGQPASFSGLGQLLIPSIEVENSVIDVPIVSGKWDISELDSGIGLLEATGRFPGDLNNMTFVAHSTTYWPVKGPFGDLHRMEHGEEIIYRLGETEFVYEITRFVYLDPRSTDFLIKPNSDQILLVTCSDYNFQLGNYNKRLLVEATLVEKKPFSDNLTKG